MRGLRIALGGLLSGGVLLTAGCTSATSGTVTSKQHTPAYTAYIPTCASYGANGVCNVWFLMPYEEPECYAVNFRNPEEDTEGSTCVDPADYETYQLGDHYPRQVDS